MMLFYLEEQFTHQDIFLAGTFLSIKEKLTQVLTSAKEMYSSLNHCLSLVTQQEEVRNLVGLITVLIFIFSRFFF